VNIRKTVHQKLNKIIYTHIKPLAVIPYHMKQTDPLHNPRLDYKVRLAPFLRSDLINLLRVTTRSTTPFPYNLRRYGFRNGNLLRGRGNLTGRRIRNRLLNFDLDRLLNRSRNGLRKIKPVLKHAFL